MPGFSYPPPPPSISSAKSLGQKFVKPPRDAFTTNFVSFTQIPLIILCDFVLLLLLKPRMHGFPPLILRHVGGSGSIRSSDLHDRQVCDAGTRSSPRRQEQAGDFHDSWSFGSFMMLATTSLQRRQNFSSALYIDQ